MRTSEEGSLTCPRCGHHLVICRAEIYCIAMPRNPVGIPLGLAYGRLDGVPIPMGDNSPAFCNHVNCNWEGTYADAAA